MPKGRKTPCLVTVFLVQELAIKIDKIMAVNRRILFLILIRRSWLNITLN